MSVRQDVADLQTKGLSLEEIGGRFGDAVVVHLTEEDARTQGAGLEANHARTTHADDSKGITEHKS